MLLGFLGGRTVDKNVVQIGEREVQIFQNIIYESLESLGSGSQTKGYEEKLKKGRKGW
jgi:hypothetical protein